MDKGNFLPDKESGTKANPFLYPLMSPATVAICMVVASAISAYIINELPWVNIRSASWSYWNRQIDLLLCYLLIFLCAWPACKGIECLIDKSNIGPIRGSLIGGMAVFIINWVVFYIFVSPLYLLMSGTVWVRPLSTWFIASALYAVIYASSLVHRIIKKQEKRRLHLMLQNNALETALDQAELSMLESQIEPHFLFNTLAHIRRQYQIDSMAADTMLSSLTKYLGKSIPALKRSDWSIEDELDLISTYLQILSYRFGDRLSFSIIAGDEVESMPIPALTITTLVENAVRHGLAPKPEGGLVSISVKTIGKALKIEVCDDGVGLQKTSGSGIGLITVQARIQAAFGKTASLSIESRSPAGVCASIMIPLETGNAKRHK